MIKFSCKLTFLILLLLFSCKEEARLKTKSLELQYGLTFNPVRQFIGLEPLNVTWESSAIQNYHNPLRIDWLDKKNIIYNPVVNKTCYGAKSILFEFNIPIKESDYYISFKCHDVFKLNGTKTKINNYIYYCYQFIPDNFNKVGWSYYYSTDLNEKVRGNITKNEADSILHSWGISRLSSL